VPPLTDLDEANSTIVALHAEIERLREQLARLKRQVFGSRREKVNPNQMRLFEEGAQLLEQLERQAEAESDRSTARNEGKKRRKHGRKPFADHLERKTIELDVPEADRCCGDCGCEMKLIGQEVTERGHMQPARLVVHRYVRNKYACKHGHTVLSAPLPDGVVEKGKYEASVYAHVITAKYADHLPLHRIQGMLRRRGFDLPKQTMWDMLARFDELAGRPILAEMRRQLLDESDLQTDETPIKIQTEGQRATRRGYLWVYRNPRQSEPQKVVADFRDNRSAEGPDKFLGDWSGTLLRDAYAGTDPIAKRNGIVIAECHAHARRKVVEALDAGQAKAAPLLRLIQRVFWIERAVQARAERDKLDFAGLADLRLKVRERRSKPIFRRLYDLVFALDEDPATQSNETMRSAVRYWINQRKGLLAHLENGRIPIHNNDTERDIRHVVIGRKNWMTFASQRGGEVAGRLYSLVASCKLNGVNVEEYLEDLLRRISTTPMSRISELTPWGWAKARAAEAVQPA